MFADKPKEAAALLRLESMPPGAEAKASFGMSCHTPCILPMGGGGHFTVTFVRAGYLPQTLPVSVSGFNRPLRVEPNPVVARLVPAAGGVKRIPARSDPTEPAIEAEPSE